ncbi:hypothetical protein PFLUV_G00261510 [Perca fluviatilis]|uniref:Uncharacterized protein n=1 Tax=Perca fluviatilis TaxID=8168 RepID=A0A6A5E286_PERFL|nr:hypothetical protein PFLUV_G00261510 [Perca fluviatilis]
MVRPSYAESTKAFIDEQPVGTNIAEYLTKRTSTEVPHVLLLEDRHQFSQAFVIVHGHALEHPSLLGAVDACFKAFYVFDVQYPRSCAQVWEFLQTIYGIPGHVRSSVQMMRAQFAAQ